MSNIAIKVEELSKQYRLGVVGTGTISHDLNRWWHRIRGNEDPYLKIGEINDRNIKGISEYVWALRNINFEVKQGEVLGIIGKNGAGKSTLLKLLSRVTAPTTGFIKTKGRIASLLEVGTGFHEELTGRENIFLNGAILGMTKAEIRSKLDDIVDFSGTERYIDTPVKRYSSGMRVRLAFAVAAHLEPEILIVDEVLAVGDAEFQRKAIGKMKDITKGGGRTVLFVSHSMNAIQNLCSKVMVIEHGTTVFEGSVDAGIDYYISSNKEKSNLALIERKDRRGKGRIKFYDVGFFNIKNEPVGNIITGKDIIIRLYYKITIPVFSIIFRIQVIDSQGRIVFICNNFHSSEPIPSIARSGYVDCIIPNLPLLEGSYSLNLQCLSDKVVEDEIEGSTTVDVINGDFFGTGKLPAIKEGILVKHKWIYE